MTEQQVILVDEKDNFLGTTGKGKAHKEGLLHRAFSIFIINSKGEIMLQKRAKTKYHSPLLWTNTCCSHQIYGETSLQAGRRRLMEEMNIDCELVQVFSFVYKADLDRGLTEHEFDHVLFGYFNGEPILNPDEVEDWKWISIAEIKRDIKINEMEFTPWLKIILDKFSHFFEPENIMNYKKL
ncbi:isopentenyl-diphosphate Delta-isomerase [Ichthyobacterium seriolicida]|uniref:Isopentenyl-diphosphate delta-isomerase n=1 Tax=Ichthyobacterium seriolicida TaxID=242600 RepID=A0A1J1E1W0_9FLAO|nr:isopentenyl-diphosphate Delta-isomerase [Ichthyobacterium seriolicida]BAV94941.1 isopentenyl-diphosphate delta-isomerase [Ichthyobacterium seriolicida]